MSGVFKKIAAFVAARKLFFSIIFFASFVVFKTYYEAKDISQFLIKISLIAVVALIFSILLKWQLKSLTKKIEENRNTVSTIIFGKAAYGITGFPFDYILYPLAIISYGWLFGGFLMTLGAGIICYMYLILYNKLKVDWLGIELVKENLPNDKASGFIKKIEASSWIGKIFWVPYSKWWLLKFWILNKGGLPAFLYLAAQHDPFYIAAFFCKGSFGKMTKRDWKIFIAGVVVSNGYWIGCNILGILLIDFVSKKFIGFSFISYIQNLF